MRDNASRHLLSRRSCGKPVKAGGLDPHIATERKISPTPYMFVLHGCEIWPKPLLYIAGTTGSGVFPNGNSNNALLCKLHLLV